MKRFVHYFTIIMICYSCNKDNYEFPLANVNLYLYPNNPEYNGLNIPGNSAKIEGGVNGILIFHDLFGQYIAYDRACTHNPLDPCEQVDINPKNTNNLLCLCCKSEFFMFDGAIINGPAQQALHRYRTSFDGIKLSIFN